MYMGLYPAPFTETMQTSVADLLQHVSHQQAASINRNDAMNNTCTGVHQPGAGLRRNLPADRGFRDPADRHVPEGSEA
jgi:hypothetical protein